MEINNDILKAAFIKHNKWKNDGIIIISSTLKKDLIYFGYDYSEFSNSKYKGLRSNNTLELSLYLEELREYKLNNIL